MQLPALDLRGAQRGMGAEHWWKKHPHPARFLNLCLGTCGVGVGGIYLGAGGRNAEHRQGPASLQTWFPVLWLPPWSSQTPALHVGVSDTQPPFLGWGLVTGTLRLTHLALLPVTVWGNFAHCPRCPKHGLPQTLWAFSGPWVNSGAFDQSVSNNTPCLSSLDKGILYEFGCLI